MYNDIHGRENDKVKLDKMPSYKPPNKDDPREIVPKKKRVRQKKQQHERRRKLQRKFQRKKSSKKVNRRYKIKKKFSPQVFVNTTKMYRLFFLVK